GPLPVAAHDARVRSAEARRGGVVRAAPPASGPLLGAGAAVLPGLVRRAPAGLGGADPVGVAEPACRAGLLPGRSGGAPAGASAGRRVAVLLVGGGRAGAGPALAAGVLGQHRAGVRRSWSGAAGGGPGARAAGGCDRFAGLLGA